MRKLLAVALALGPWPLEAKPICLVTDYGAKCDGATLDTLAFNRTIAACALDGYVALPPGRTCLTAPFNLTSGQTLVIPAGTVLLGTADRSKIPLMKPFPSMGGDITRDGFKCRYAPLVGAYNASDVAITGGGVIDGQGAAWWSDLPKHAERPRLVEVQYVEGLTVRNVTLRNSPFWTLHPYACRNVLVKDVAITAEGAGREGSNTDGVDPDSCEDVLIEDYHYCAGDDAVAVKSGWNWAGQHFNRPSRNVTVRRAFSGCRGGFTIGSEMSGGVDGVVFEDSVSTGDSGMRISSELGRGGYVRNVVFRNLTFSWEKVEGKSFLLHVNQEYIPDNPNKTLSFFSNIRFEDIVVKKAPKGMPMGDISCLRRSPCLNVTLSRVRLEDVEAPKPLACRNAHGSLADVDAKVARATCLVEEAAGGLAYV